MPEYQRRRSNLEQKLEALKTQEHQLDAQVDRHQELNNLTNSVEDFCNRVKTGLASADFDQKRQLVELLVDRVIATDGEVEIRYVIPTSPTSENTHFCHLRSDYLTNPTFGNDHKPGLLIISYFRVTIPLFRPVSKLVGWLVRAIARSEA